MQPSPPLALTMGEPGGVGTDLTLAVWRDRVRLDVPPFYLLADPDFVADRAPAARPRLPDQGGRGPRCGIGVRRCASSRAAAGHGSGRAGPGGPGERHRGRRGHRPRRRRRPLRRCRGHGDQSDQQAVALRRRVPASRPHRVPRHIVRGLDRRTGATGDDARRTRASGGPGHDSCAAPRRGGHAQRGDDRRDRADRGAATSDAGSPSPVPGSRSPGSILTPARAARSASRTGRSSRRPSTRSAPGGSTSSARSRPTPCSTQRRAPDTTPRSACITTRR